MPSHGNGCQGGGRQGGRGSDGGERQVMTTTVAIRTKWAKLAVVLVGLFVAGLFAGAARADAGPPATLTTDNASYVPGDTVELSGANWTPGESVHIHVADAGGYDWSFDDDVAAAADGTIADSVTLPTAFASDFAAVATAALGASATTSFSSDFAALPPPMIVTDKADYAPGETVTLTGANWQPGESIHIVVNDSAGQTWSYTADVTTDGSGDFM